MTSALRRKLYDLGRSVVGALLLGMPLLYTMETWWLGWRLEAWRIMVWSLLGLLLISVVVHQVGFRKGVREKEQPWWQEITDFTELLAASFLAGLLVLFLFGIVEWGDPLGVVVRLGLYEVVPLGIGAAVTNQALSGAEEDGTAESFRREMAVFALGALFFAFNVAPTEEMELMAAHAGPLRLAFVVVASLVLSYMALYVLHFRGAAGRRGARTSRVLHMGETVTGYAIAVLVSMLLLWGYGHFDEPATVAEMAQTTVVLAFVAAMGGAAARVVI